MDIIKELEQRGRLAKMLTESEIARIVGVYKKEQLATDVARYKEQITELQKLVTSLEAK